MNKTLLPLAIMICMSFVTFPESYASCAATIIPQPCFDSFMSMSEVIDENSEPRLVSLNETKIMEMLSSNINANYDSWEMTNRNWAHVDSELELPAIICTEFVGDGIMQYRMAKWVDEYTISSFENFRNDWMCDKWLPPIVFEYDISWDKTIYESDGIGIVTITDTQMNLDSSKVDFFDIHVHSDTDHTGTEITMTETDIDSGIFEGTVLFTTTEESSGARLLVEDAVYAQHKLLNERSKIINESREELDHQSKSMGYEESENTKLARDRLNEADQTFGGPGPALYDGYSYFPMIFVAIGIVIFSLYIWKKRE